jgi:hypothetical protein
MSFGIRVRGSRSVVVARLAALNTTTFPASARLTRSVEPARRVADVRAPLRAVGLTSAAARASVSLMPCSIVRIGTQLT